MKNVKEWMEVSDGWKDLYEKTEEERNSLFVKVEELRQKIRDLEKEQVQHIDILADQFAKQNAGLKELLDVYRQALQSIAANHVTVSKLKSLTYEQALEVVQNDTLLARKALGL